MAHDRVGAGSGHAGRGRCYFGGHDVLRVRLADGKALHRSDEFGRRASAGGRPAGPCDLPAAQLVKLGLAQADMALSRLKAFLGDAPLPSTDAVREETEKSSPDRDAIRKAR